MQRLMSDGPYLIFQDLLHSYKRKKVRVAEVLPATF